MSRGNQRWRGEAAFWKVAGLVVVSGAILGLAGCKSHPEQRKVYSHEGQETEEEWPQNNSGPDAPAPYRAGKARESEQNVSDSTPTPPPNRPIDRPLDPTGLPMNGPTP